MDLNKHIIDNNRGNLLHSHGYAQVLNGDRLGASDNTSFKQRQTIDYNRRLVGGYHRSAIGSSSGVSRPYTAKNIHNNPSLRIPNKPQTRRFNEPTNRGYNPYS